MGIMFTLARCKGAFQAGANCLSRCGDGRPTSSRYRDRDDVRQHRTTTVRLWPRRHQSPMASGLKLPALSHNRNHCIWPENFPFGM